MEPEPDARVGSAAVVAGVDLVPVQVVHVACPQEQGGVGAGGEVEHGAGAERDVVDADAVGPVGGHERAFALQPEVAVEEKPQPRARAALGLIEPQGLVEVARLAEQAELDCARALREGRRRERNRQDREAAERRGFHLLLDCAGVRRLLESRQNRGKGAMGR